MTEPAEQTDDLNPITWRTDIQKLIAADAAAEWDAVQAREHAERARQAQVEAAEIEAANAASAAIVDEYQTAVPPEFTTLELDGLSPARAMLVRYHHWLETLRQEHAALVAGREKFLAAQGIASMTKAAIAKLIADDRSGLVALMASGGELTQQQTRGAERKKLEAKLAADEHNRDVAVAALIEVDAKIDTLATTIEVIAGRHEAFVADALQEHLIATAGAKMVGHADVLRDAALTTMGAYGAILALKGVSWHARPHQISLPTPKLPGEAWNTGTPDSPGFSPSSGAGYTIDFPVHLQDAVQKKWLEKAHLLLSNPHADLGDK